MSGLIQYTPFDLGFELPGEGPCDLRLSYCTMGEGDEGIDRFVEKLVADFSFGEDFLGFVRIEFEGEFIFRVLDELWLSTTSNPNRWTGDLSSFARTVRGDDFAELHSFYFELKGEAKHYQFVTNSACVDVIAYLPPKISLHS